MSDLLQPGIFKTNLTPLTGPLDTWFAMAALEKFRKDCKSAWENLGLDAKSVREGIQGETEHAINFEGNQSNHIPNLKRNVLI